MKTLVEKVSESAKFVTNRNNEFAEQFVWDCLEQLGITDDDVGHELLMSSDSKEGDFRQVFCDKMKLPVPRFRRIWRILKEGTHNEVCKDSSEGITKEDVNKITPVGQWSDEALLSKYSHICCDRSVDTELKVRSEMQPCIVFSSRDKIDVDISLMLLRESRHREISNTYKTAGKIYKVYRVGEFPEDTYMRCPISGHILLDGYSEKIGIIWDIPYEAMQFIALLVKEGVEINAIVARDLKKEYKARGIDGFKELFPKIALKYEELEKINELPNLKVVLNSRDAMMDALGKKY